MEYSPALPAGFRLDGLAEIFAEVGNTRQFGSNIVNLGGLGGARWAYAEGGVMARIVDDPADMATKQGVTIKHGTEALDNELDRLQVMARLSDALRWALLDGGGALVILTKDGASLEEPLVPANVQEIEEFRVVSAISMRGDKDGRYDDPRLANYGQPQFYLIDAQANTITNGNQYRVHETRIIPIPGAPMAVIGGVDMRDIPWMGRGVSRAAVLAIQRWRRTVKLGEALMERSQQAVHKMKGLADMLLAKQEATVRARINLVDANRSAMNGVAVDADDSYEILNASLAGVKDVIQEAQTAVAAEVGYPQTWIFGRSPGGLNSTGDGDWALVYSNVEQLQAKRLTPALERIISLILAQSSVKAEDKPEDWRIKWNPLAPLTRQQLADVQNKEADTVKKVTEALKIAQDSGAVSQDEAHEYLQAENMFGLDPENTGGDANARQYAGQT